MSLNIIIPYLQIFNTITSIVLHASPIVAFIPIIKGKEKYTNIPVLMLIFNILNNLGWGCYWYRVSRYVPVFCSIICEALATFFSFIYLYFYSKKKIQKFLFYILLLIIFDNIIIYICLYLIYSLKVLGIILIVINTFVYISPGQNIIKVIKNKNHKLIPITTTVVGIISSAGWLLYGQLLNELVGLGKGK